jgi:hypothetical protein
VRQVLAGIAAVLVVVAVVAVGWRALEGNEAVGSDAADGPEAAVDAYLGAWASGDHDRMVGLVRTPPDGFVAHHDQLREGLGVDALTVERTDLVEDVDGRATATATVTADVPDVGPLTWDVEVRVLRERGSWGVAWAPDALHPEWRPGLRFTVTTIETERAPILATDGTQLAGPGQRVTFGVEPGAVASRDDLIEAFDAAVPGSGATAARLLDQPGLVDGWFYPVVSLSPEVAGDAGRELRGVPGVLSRSEDGARSLLADDFAVHVVGRTGEATAEELERLGPPYEPGDVIGRTGLEAAFEARLVEGEQIHVELRDGVDGPVRATLATSVDGDGDIDGAGDAAGDGAGDGDEPAAVEGTDPDAASSDPRALRTTIDVTVQRAIENTLLGRETPAAIVAVEVDSGAIRGVASRPIDGFDRALQGRYPPGLAVAPIVVDALASTDRDPTLTVACPAEVVAGGRRVGDPDGDDLGDLDLPSAVAAGCSTTFATLGADLGGEALTDAAARFGAGRDLDLPLVSNGFDFPPPADAGEAAVAAAGRGTVEVSPVHLATIAAAASSGRWSPPFLLEDDGPADATPLGPGALDGTQRLLAAPGAGTGADLDAPGLAGFSAVAPTFDGREHRWFVGTVDAVAIAVLLEDDGEAEDGVDDPAEVAARFARELRALADAPVDADRPA